MIVANSTIVTPSSGRWELRSGVARNRYASVASRLERPSRRQRGTLVPALPGVASSRATTPSCRPSGRLDDVTVLDEVGIVQRLLRRLILMRHDSAVSDEHRHPLGRRPRLHVGQHAIAKSFASVVGPQRRLIAELAEHVVEPDAAQKTFEQMRQQVAELQPSSVGALHGVIVDGRHQRERVAAERRQFEAALLQLRHEQAAHFVRQQSARQIRLETAAATAAPRAHRDRRRCRSTPPARSRAWPPGRRCRPGHRDRPTPRKLSMRPSRAAIRASSSGRSSNGVIAPYTRSGRSPAQALLHRAHDRSAPHRPSRRSARATSVVGRTRRCACRAARRARAARARAGSPSRVSTLITSAPKSASIIVASPPTGPDVASTTRKFSRGFKRCLRVRF